jgi:hypothetical protein
MLVRVFVNIKYQIFKDPYSCVFSDCVALFPQLLDVYYILLFR